MNSQLVQHNKSVLSSLNIGDMVEIDRGWFSHWGVYSGNGNLIHLSGNGNSTVDSGSTFSGSSLYSNKATVQEDNFWDVVKGRKAKKNNDKDNSLTPLDRTDIVSRARSMIGRVGYNLFSNNCEHFASSCRYGKNWSKQVQRGLTAVMVIGAVVVVCGLLFGR